MVILDPMNWSSRLTTKGLLYFFSFLLRSCPVSNPYIRFILETPAPNRKKESQRWYREKEIYMDVKNRCIATPASFPKLSSRKSQKFGPCRRSRSINGGARMANVISVPVAMTLIYEQKSTICYLCLLLTDWIFLSSLAQEREWESPNREAVLQSWCPKTKPILSQEIGSKKCEQSNWK